MQTQQTYTTDNRKKVIGVAGAIIGAGVALAAAKVLSDKKNRKKIMATITDVKDKVKGSIETLQHETKDLTKSAKKTKKAAPAKTTQRKKIDRPRDEKGHFIKQSEPAPATSS